MSATASSRARSFRLPIRTSARIASSCNVRIATTCSLSISSTREAADGWSTTCTSSPRGIPRRRASRPPEREPARRRGRFLFGQLEQDARRRFGMHERDAPAAGAAARRVVHEPVARRAAPGERRVEIRDAIADVVDPRTPFGEKLRDGARGIAGLEQLDGGVAEGQADDGGAVRGFRAAGRLEAQDIAVEPQRLGEARYGDPDMGEAGGHWRWKL